VSVAERAGRWCRRNPAVATLLALLFLVLSTGLAGVTWKWLEAEQLRKDESEAREAAVASEADAKNERQHAVNLLYRSLVREARATRLAHRMGYRKEVFGRLREAMALDTPQRDLEQLREEASACLGDFVGLEPTIWDDLPAPLAGGDGNNLAVSPNGKLAAFALQDGTIRIRDVATGVETGKVSGNAWRWIIFGHDSRTLFSVAGVELKTWKADADGRWAMVHSRKLKPGTRNVVCGVDQYLTLSGVDSQQKIEAFAWENDKPLGSVTVEKNTRIENTFLTRDRQRIVALGSKEAKPCLFVGNLESGKLEAIPWEPGYAWYGRVLSWDGRYLASVTDEGIGLYDLERRQHLPFIRSEGNLLSARFSHDGRYLLISAFSGTIHFWSLAANRETARLSMGGGSWIYPALQLSGDDQLLAVGRAGERRIRLWNLAGSGEKLVLAGHDRAVPCAVFGPDGKRIASASKDHQVKIWDAQSGTLRHTLPRFQGLPQELVFTRGGRYLFAGEQEGGLSAWDLETFQSIPIVGGPQPHPIFSLDLSPDGVHLALTLKNDGLRIYRIDGAGKVGEVRRTFKLQHVRHFPSPFSTRVRFSPNGKRLAWTDSDRVRLYDFEQAREVPFRAPQLLSGWFNLNWYPDSTHLAFVTGAKVGEVWNVATGKRVMYFGRPGELQQHISSLSPDGRWFVCSPTGTAAVLWDARTGKRLLTLPEESSGIWCYSWSPDNKRVALSLTDGGVVVWDLASVRQHLAALGLDWTDTPPGEGPVPLEEQQAETPTAPLSP
jgi:WD40 repeat protein